LRDINVTGSVAKNPNNESKIYFHNKDHKKQNISPITSKIRQLFPLKNQINLKLKLKQIYLGMNTAIPVGIIVNYFTLRLLISSI